MDAMVVAGEEHHGCQLAVQFQLVDEDALEDRQGISEEVSAGADLEHINVDAALATKCGGPGVISNVTLLVEDEVGNTADVSSLSYIRERKRLFDEASDFLNRVRSSTLTVSLIFTSCRAVFILIPLIWMLW